MRRPLLPCALLLVLLPSLAHAATWYRDADEDGYGDPNDTVTQATQPAGYVATSGDCDDTDPNVHPGATELCNGIDDDCDTTIEPSEIDNDGDGVSECEGDCDDTDPSVFPGATEVCNGIDDDCDGTVDEGVGSTWYQDADLDGYGDPSVTQDACSQPVGYVATSGDCDDSDPSVFPGATEVCNTIDDDCDGQVDENVGTTWYADADGDGYGDAGTTQTACTQPIGYVADSTDCDDSDPNVNPGATEVCNTIDDDCDGQVDENCAGIAIISIVDVGNDQGRRVRVNWQRAAHDVAGSGTTIESYSLYRRVEPGLGSLQKATPPGDWDFVKSVPATGDDDYFTTATTLCDSTDAGICWSTFFVRAHTPDPLAFFDSAVDSGYSVDNLAPQAPQSLVADYGSSEVQLSWEESEAEDFGHFRIYAGSDASFELDAGNLVASTVNPNFTDASSSPWSQVYKVTTVDLNGNESEAVSPQSVTSAPAPKRYSLGEATPNPFNPRTTIRFTVPDGGGKVRLEVFDVSGRRVDVLADRRFEGGEHTAVWTGRDEQGRPLSSGVYFYRMTAPGVQESRKMVLVR